VGLIPVLGFVFSPGGGSEQIKIKTYLPNSSNLDYNLSQMKVVEKEIFRLPEGELKSLHSRVGTEEPFGLDPKPGDSHHKSTLLLYLTPETERQRPAEKIAEELRNNFKKLKSAACFQKSADQC
jgi:multidrug efflux pump subunit AcrB